MSHTFAIRHDHVDSLWHLVWPAIERSYQRTALARDVPVELLRQMLGEQKLQLWVDMEKRVIVAAGVTRVDESPSGRLCTVIAAGSDDKGHDWTGYLATIGEWAKNVEGCNRLQVNGRKGWERRLKPAGFALDSILLTKDL